MDDQLIAAFRTEFVHLTLVAIYGVFTGLLGLIAWLIRRDLRSMDNHFQQIDEKLDEVAEGVSWCKGVLHASGLSPRPLGPGIGGST